jgi:hypothetical protein
LFEETEKDNDYRGQGTQCYTASSPDYGAQATQFYPESSPSLLDPLYSHYFQH